MNPHGPRSQGPRIVPSAELAKGTIEVRLISRDVDLIDNRQVTLSVTHESIAQGNKQSTLEATTSVGGIAVFPSQGTESDWVYKVSAAVGDAHFSTSQFQFKTGGEGLRIIIPVLKSSSDLNGLLILSRCLYAVIPQDNTFNVDVLWRIENYSEVAWVPDDTTYPLPAGAKALTIREAEGDGHFESANDGKAIRLAGTFGPGQQDLLLRFQLPADGKATRDLTFPAAAHLGTLRVLLDSSPTMSLKVDGAQQPEETRNQEGQRRLIATRDFLSEKVRAPDKIEVHIAGIPTPPAGRPVAVGLAAVIALGGLSQGLGRRSKARTPSRALLSKEDREHAGKLLLDEMIRLERAFKQGEIGRKTHEQAKRQLLEAYARLGAGQQALPA
jgi:hypothetical protein